MSMTINTVDLIFNHIKKINMVDSESIAYFPNNYPFSRNEFDALWDYFDVNYRNEHDDCTGTFFEARLYLEYKGEQYIWRVLSGQGTTCQFFYNDKEFLVGKYPDPDVPFKFKEDKKIILGNNFYNDITKIFNELMIKDIIE